jgi:hypothetical protein
MREERISLEEFCRANRLTRVVHLLTFLARLGPAAIARLDRITECRRFRIQHINDLDIINKVHLVRYKPNSRGEIGWEYTGSLPYTVEEYASVLPNVNPSEYASISSLAHSMEKSLLEDVVLTIAHDTGLRRRIIVDGVHRSTALVLLSRTNMGLLARLLAGPHEVTIVELRSGWAHVLYPCDFLEFHRQSGEHAQELR